MYRRHSHVAAAAYNDLVRLLLDEAMSDLRGAPVRMTISGRSYWYDRFRLGQNITESHLGEDTPELRSRIDRHDRLRADRTGRDQERGRLIRLLRGERFLGADGSTGGLLTALARAGLFRPGGVLIATNAFRMYEGELGFVCC